MIVGENTYIIKGKIVEGMTDEEFFHFCQENETINFERDENRNIIVMPPTGSYSGNINANITYELVNWNKKKKSGETFDSSTGFTLPDGSNRSPDAAWILNENWDALTDAQKQVFAPICPAFIIELRSKSDKLSYLKDKMHKWINNGAQLAWLIDPYEEKAYIYRKDGSIEIVNSFEKKLSGEDVLEGFELDLNRLR